MLAVDAGTDGNHRCRVALQDGYVVEGAVVALNVLAVGGHLYQGTVFHAVVALTKGINTGLHLVGSYVGKEAHPANVHADDGHLVRPYTAGGLQQGAVAAKGEGKIAGRKFGKNGVVGILKKIVG